MIEFQDVSVVYSKEHTALSHVSLRIEKGEFVCIVGPIGAGKSTLLKLIYHAEVPTRGRVIVAGQDLSDFRPRDVVWLRRCVGVVSPDFGLLPNRTLFENVALPLRMMGAGPRVVDKRVCAALEMVDLLPRSAAFPNQVSAGEQQLVAIARAIVYKPSILIVDAPTGNLDVESSTRVAQILSQIHRRGATVVVATNDRQIAVAARWRHAAFEQGCLLRDEKGDASAAPADIDENLRHDTLNPEPARTKPALDGPTFMRGPRLRDFLKEVGRNLRCNGLASLAALLIVIFSMVILGGALLALYRLRQVANVLPQHFEIAVFLREDLPRAEALTVQTRIEDLPGVAHVQLVTKEQAWTRLTQKSQAGGINLVDALEGENPLPDRLDVRVKDPRELAAMADSLCTLNEVGRVSDARAALDHTLAALQWVNALCGAVALLVFLAIALVIRNTLRSTLFARRHDLKIMGLVGATPGFVRIPLALSGIFFGVAGGAAAGSLLLLCVYRLSTWVQPELPPLVQTLPPLARPELLVGALMGIGLLVGLMGSTLSIDRFLRRV